jgi:hypothetical protein
LLTSRSGENARGPIRQNRDRDRCAGYIQLAQETNETVLSTPVATADAPVEVLKTAPVEAVAPNGETVDTAVVVEAPPVQSAAVDQAPVPAAEPAASLPKTASDLPLIGLAGLLLLGGGFALFGLSKLNS